VPPNDRHAACRRALSQDFRALTFVELLTLDIDELGLLLGDFMSVGNQTLNGAYFL
jgi:hypothetical protein